MLKPWCVGRRRWAQGGIIGYWDIIAVLTSILVNLCSENIVACLYLNHRTRFCFNNMLMWNMIFLCVARGMMVISEILDSARVCDIKYLFQLLHSLWRRIRRFEQKVCSLASLSFCIFSPLPFWVSIFGNLWFWKTTGYSSGKHLGSVC